jgi:putative tricarboxylic transport membrane protein
MSKPEANGPGWHALVTVAVVLFGLAAVIASDVTRMAPAQAVGVGPTAVMRLVAMLLTVLGLAHIVAALRLRATLHGKKTPELDAALTNRAALGWVLGGLVGMILILRFDGGFVVGSTWLFAATARAFGQPIRIKSPVIGFVLAAAVYAFFTKALSLSLPAGALERLLLS